MGNYYYLRHQLNMPPEDYEPACLNCDFPFTAHMAEFFFRYAVNRDPPFYKVPRTPPQPRIPRRWMVNFLVDFRSRVRQIWE